MEQRLITPTRILGQASALAFAGIGWAPLDGSPLTFALHMVLVFVAFGTVMGICLLMTVLISRSERYPTSCAVPYVVLFAALTLFMGVMAWWGLARTIAGYLALTIGQKIIVSLLVGNLLFQGIVTFRLSGPGSQGRE